MIGATLIGMAADRSRLVPTVVTDRNGKWTTVHRRPGQAGNGQAAQLPAPTAAGGEPSGLERLTALLAEMSRGRPMGVKKQAFLSACSERSARILADTAEEHPGFIEILRAQTTVLVSDRHHEIGANPSVAVAIARVYEEGAVKQPRSSNATEAAHALHAEYGGALTRVTMAAQRVGMRTAGPLFDDFDPKYRDAAREGVRAVTALKRSPVGLDARDVLLDAVVRGECTAADIEAAIRDHGAETAQQIIALAAGETPALSDGWL